MKRQQASQSKLWIPQNRTSIKDQTNEVNTPVDSITIEATDNSGQAVTNKVSGLPEGVSFDSTTNTISGTPTKVGSYPPPRQQQMQKVTQRQRASRLKLWIQQNQR